MFRDSSDDGNDGSLLEGYRTRIMFGTRLMTKPFYIIWAVT